MSDELVELTAAQQALANVETPAEAKDLYDKLEALGQYARRYRLDQDKQNEIAITKLRAARRGGELLAETIGHSGGSPSHGARDLPEQLAVWWSAQNSDPAS